MKPQPTPKPQPLQTVVAVPTLTPEFALWNEATKELKRIIGGNLQVNSVYLKGESSDMPKIFRMAAEEGSYEHELLFEPLPNTIQEVPLDEYPECEIVITNARIMQIAVAETAQPECKVIETAYARSVREQKEAKAAAERVKKAREQGCIPLQLEFDYQPSKLTA